MSEQKHCSTCGKILKDSELSTCQKCSNRFRNKKPEPKSCVSCGQQFYSYWRRQKFCFDCISEKLARVNVCLWCRTPLRVKKHFCSPICDMEYGEVSHKIIMGFPLDQIKYELLVLKKSGVNYHGLEKLESAKITNSD